MNKHENKLYLVRCLVTIGLLSILISLWQCLEVSLYGEIQHRVVDDIIIIPIMISIYLNVKHWIKGLF